MIVKSKNILNILVYLLVGSIILYSVNQFIISNKQEDTFIFEDQADTINRMNIYMSKNSIDDNFLMNLASSYENLFLYQDAIEKYKLVLKNDGLNQEINFKLINLYILEGNFQEAKKIGESLLKNNIYSVAIYETLALLSLIEEDYKTAIDYIGKALDLSQENEQVQHLNLFLSLLNTKYLNSNDPTINQKIIDFVSYPTIKDEIIINLVANSNEEELESYYESLGRAYLRKGNYEESAKIFSKEINQKNANGHTYNAIVLAYLLDDNTSKLKDFMNNYNQNFSNDEREMIDLIINYKHSNDISYLSKIGKILSSTDMKNKFYFSFILGHYYEIEEDYVNSSKYYYAYLKESDLNLTDLEYWSVLQKDVISSLGENEIKTNKFQ